MGPYGIENCKIFNKLYICNNHIMEVNYAE